MSPDARTVHTDVNVLAALHHPARRRLLELLGLDGPSTVSQLADAVEERVGNVSHHLKVLAEAGLIEEAPELARDRRERWWRSAQRRMSWTIADVAGDPVGEAIASAAEQQNLTHDVSKVHQWFSRRGSFDESWVRAAFSTDGWVEVDQAELAELGDRINALINEYAVDRYRHRGTDDAPGPSHNDSGADRRSEPADREPDNPRQRAFVFAYGVPARP
jgi:DNA-binding transcriptional ArsR family regulator